MRLAMLFASLIAFPALAGDLVVTWTYPTTNTDGSAIPATGAGSVTSSRIEYGTCVGSAFGTQAGQRVVPAPALTTTFTNVAPGTWCVRGYVSNTYGVESPASSVAQKVIPPPTPNAPTVTVAVVIGAMQAPVYSVLASNARSVFVGFADLGKACGDAVLFRYRGFDFREVARSDVYLWGSTSLRLAAPCGTAG